MSRFIDLTGQVFSKLTVIERDAKRQGAVYWICSCSCGNTTSVRASSLSKSLTKSCGCFHIAASIARQTSHGQSRSKVYRIWKSMKDRCFNHNNPNYSNYGGRGITIHPDWIDSFELFYLHIGERPSTLHSVDRINNDLGYIPGNVRWATQTEQSNNHRRNRKLTYMGITLTITQWANRIGMNQATLRGRCNDGWSVEKAISTPVKSCRTSSSLT